MGRHAIQPSRRAAGTPEIRQMVPTAAADLTKGEPVQRNAADPDLIEAHAGGATVTGILGFAMGPVSAGEPAYGDTIPVAIANTDTEFLGQMMNAGSLVTPVAATHLGVSYGLIEVNGAWYVDEADTTNVVVRITEVFPDIGCVLFKVLPSAIGQ